MKKVLASFGIGPECSAMLDIARPGFERYAARHGYSTSFDFPNQPPPMMHWYRPASWYKIQVFIELFDQGTDLILWLDADTLIIDDKVDVADFMAEDKIQGHVRHRQNTGIYANCGVWLLRPAMIPWLVKAWNADKWLYDSGWEQTAIMEMMGARLDSEIAKLEEVSRFFSWNWREENELRNLSASLPHEFNWMYGDYDRTPTVSIYHMGEHPRKVEAMIAARDAGKDIVSYENSYELWLGWSPKT